MTQVSQSLRLSIFSRFLLAEGLVLARQSLVATISRRRLVGVEMTCASVTLGERIKDGPC